ncbi:MAG: hypothetical protein MJZ92_01260 [Paludibacteraceae bacterium]|nr:hypothetical protein [Paludibacteraceae bacterium]
MKSLSKITGQPQQNSAKNDAACHLPAPYLPPTYIGFCSVPARFLLGSQV